MVTQRRLLSFLPSIQNVLMGLFLDLLFTTSIFPANLDSHWYKSPTVRYLNDPNALGLSLHTFDLLLLLSFYLLLLLFLRRSSSVALSSISNL